MKSFVLSALALASAASAHFTLDYPTTRGFDEDLEPKFCGGFNSTGPRSLFPLGAGAPILIDSHHPSAQVAIIISFATEPVSFANFSSTPTGSPIPFVMPFGSITGQGEWCFPVNIGALGIQGVGNGTLATIQVEFNGGDGALFQCADVILSSTFVPSNVTCVNATSNAVVASSSSRVTVSTASGAVAAPASTSARSGAQTVQIGRALAALMGVVGLIALV